MLPTSKASWLQHAKFDRANAKGGAQLAFKKNAFCPKLCIQYGFTFYIRYLLIPFRKQNLQVCFLPQHIHFLKNVNPTTVGFNEWKKIKALSEN